jgi:hypothetical protein
VTELRDTGISHDTGGQPPDDGLAGEGQEGMNKEAQP